MDYIRQKKQALFFKERGEEAQCPPVLLTPVSLTIPSSPIFII